MPRIFNNAVHQGKVDRRLPRTLKNSYGNARDTLDVEKTLVRPPFRRMHAPCKAPFAITTPGSR